MTRRQFISTALGAGLFSAGALAMSGCGGDGQPARGTISAPRKDSVGSSTDEKAKPKAATKGKPSGRGGI
jgi:hypothetical protein